MTKDRVQTLDWLRAVAVTAVVVGHFQSAYAPGGAVGVSVFFVLSGYLICGMLLRDGMLTLPNIGRFIVRRLGRIYPMYAIHLAVMSGLIVAFYPDTVPLLQKNISALLTFSRPVEDWMGYGMGVLWTLYVEFWFYVTFPFLLWLLLALPLRLSLPAKLLWSFGIIGLITFTLTMSFKVDPTIGSYDHFLLGAAAAVVVRYRLFEAAFARPGAMIGGFLIVLAMIAVPYPGDRNLAWHLQSLCAAMGTVTVILATSASAPIYQLRPIAFVGRISFSIYLVHAIVLDLIHLETNDPRWIVYPSLLLIVLVSWATFTYVEQPATRFINSRFKFRTSQSGSGDVLHDRSADQRT